MSDKVFVPFAIPSPYRPMTHTEKWIYVELLCPKCGSVQVYAEEGSGDFYVGELHICIECESGFYLPNGVFPVEDYSKIRCENLKEHRNNDQ